MAVVKSSDSKPLMKVTVIQWHQIMGYSEPELIKYLEQVVDGVIITDT